MSYKIERDYWTIVDAIADKECDQASQLELEVAYHDAITKDIEIEDYSLERIIGMAQDLGLEVEEEGAHISELNLSTRAKNALGDRCANGFRDGAFKTINELKHCIKEGKLHRVANIGELTIKQIHEAIAEWDNISNETIIRINYE